MMKGVGIDMVSVERFQAVEQVDFSKWHHVFHESEWDRAFERANKSEHLAGIFAAKEAAMKATGHVGPTGFKAFEIVVGSLGQPRVLGGDHQLLVSISHDAGMAIAIVVAL